MPLYLIDTKGSDKRRLIDATSMSAALMHAASGIFTGRRVTKPTEVGSLVKAGVEIETAGEPPAGQQHPDDKTGTEHVNIETGMIERYIDDGVSSEDVRPATITELNEADPDGRYRVHGQSGMLQRHAGAGADDDDANWGDVREAMADEIAAEPEAPAGKPDKPGKK